MAKIFSIFTLLYFLKDYLIKKTFSIIHMWVMLKVSLP